MSVRHQSADRALFSVGLLLFMNPIVVIPSRLASTRLPAKPLADIGGESMIVRVAKRALAANVGPVAVAAGDREILDAVRHLDVMAVMTDPGLASGSDRVYSALEQIDPHKSFDTIINLQGDLPFFEASDLPAVLRPLQEEAFDVGTLVSSVQDDEEAQRASVVKTACAFRSESDVARALYFSRMPIPWGGGPLWHHVGVYAWRRHALERFVSLPPSPLEKRESLEQLRVLEAGMSIGCVRIAHAPFGVDTPEDLMRVRALVKE